MQRNAIIKKMSNDKSQAVLFRVETLQSPEQKEEKLNLIRKWREIAFVEQQKNENLYRKALSKKLSKEKKILYYSKMRFFERFLDAARILLSEAKDKNFILEHRFSIVLHNDTRAIQAIAVSSPDPRDKETWQIDFILDSPYHYSSSKIKKGTTALIQDAIQQSIERQGLHLASASPSLEKIKEKTAVTLKLADYSCSFYKTLFFEFDKRKQPDHCENPLILEGDNLSHFLENNRERATQYRK